MKLTTSLGAVTVLFLAWVAGCGDDSSGTNPGGTGAAADGGEPSAAGAPSTSGSNTAGSSSGGAENVAGEASGGAAGSGSVTPCVLAADWEVVDDYAYPGATRTNAVGVAADSAGNVLVVGLALGTGMPRGLARHSTDAGQTWTDLNWIYGLPNDAAVDEAGNLFVTTGEVLKSDDQGESFQSVHDIPTVPASLNDPCSTGYVATAPGGVVVAGASCDSSGWVVSKSEDAGETWGTAFSFQLSPGKPARMQDVGVDDNGVAYATGYAIDANDEMHWVTVREGAAAGIVSDDFQLMDGATAETLGNGFATHGTPMVTGFATDGNAVHGIVRRMTSPDNWETIDTFDTRGSDVEAAGDHFIVHGTIEDGDGIRVVTRRTDDAGGTWDPIGEYSYVAGHDSRAGKLGADPAGSFYSLVGGQDQGDIPRWIVRKLACE